MLSVGFTKGEYSALQFAHRLVPALFTVPHFTHSHTALDGSFFIKIGAPFSFKGELPFNVSLSRFTSL